MVVWYGDKSGNLTCRRQLQEKAEVVRSKTINGVDIELSIITHQDNLCKEFVISSPKFSVLRWCMWTFLLTLLGYVLNVHRQVTFTFCIIIIIIIAVLVYYHSHILNSINSIIYKITDLVYISYK